MTELLAALLGSLVGGLTTWVVARAQIRHEVTSRHRERIDDLVARLHTDAQMLGVKSLRTRLPDQSRLESLTLQAGILTARARDSDSHLASIVEEGVTSIHDNLILPNDMKSGVAIVTAGPYGRSSFALSGLLAMWLRNPEKFERERPTFAAALAEVDEG